MESSQEITERIKLIELQLQNEIMENELMKRTIESLQFHINSLEHIQHVMSTEIEELKEENQIYHSELSTICNILKNSFGEDDEDVLDISEDANKKKIVSICLGYEKEVSDDCFDLIINEINNNYTISYLKAFKNILCHHPYLINGEFKKEIWHIIEDKLQGNIIEKECCIEMLIYISTLLYDIPLTVIELLSSMFQEQTTSINIKNSILIIMSYLSDNNLAPLTKIVHHIISFCLNPFYLNEQNYGTATIVLSHILPLLPNQIITLIAPDVIRLNLWQIDFGEEWRNKNHIDPHHLILLLFKSSETVETLKSTFIQNVPCLEYILNHLELRSDESLQILYEIIDLIPSKCSKFVEKLLELYPFTGDINACLTACDIFLIYLPTLSSSSFILLKQQILKTIQPFIVLNEKLTTIFHQLSTLTI
ncbi:hypothetical protein EDI_318720 [Entamoeba dispar SAW760]|uniref:Uncharacterized protein n=1 Tax=Entamoeba dispar (strain ATCC PRA-260 / SAW760) TaxID=370354 RepID=B0EAA6_ENTDS|nr:uncharacterized protein EDI_318720 [Entamoeba dispar SAW760]EDR28556.1 hypothetical protein EDI_318720 [Entamoeba dispar SAW760]|eukprot:EDR28556.1 hypothetical protein EDI_318720 [Entamoeba dispar SAW760]